MAQSQRIEALEASAGGLLDGLLMPVRQDRIKDRLPRGRNPSRSEAGAVGQAQTGVAVAPVDGPVARGWWAVA